MAPVPGPSLLARDLAAMQVDQVLDDRQAQAEAAVRAVAGRIALREAVEQVRQEVAA